MNANETRNNLTFLGLKKKVYLHHIKPIIKPAFIFAITLYKSVSVSNRSGPSFFLFLFFVNTSNSGLFMSVYYFMVYDVTVYNSAAILYPPFWMLTLGDALSRSREIYYFRYPNIHYWSSPCFYVNILKT